MPRQMNKASFSKCKSDPDMKKMWVKNLKEMSNEKESGKMSNRLKNSNDNINPLNELNNTDSHNTNTTEAKYNFLREH